MAVVSFCHNRLPAPTTRETPRHCGRQASLERCRALLPTLLLSPSMGCAVDLPVRCRRLLITVLSSRLCSSLLSCPWVSLDWTRPDFSTRFWRPTAMLLHCPSSPLFIHAPHALHRIRHANTTPCCGQGLQGSGLKLRVAWFALLAPITQLRCSLDAQSFFMI